MSRNLLLWVFVALLFVGCTLAGQRLLAQTSYSLPDNDSSCPANCRQIPWQAGSDLWNGGVLPTYTSVTCAGVKGDGTTDDGPAIQSCINAASPHTAVFLPEPSDCYYINSTVRLVSNVVLRGTGGQFNGDYDICEGSNAFLTTQNFSFGSNLNPATSYGVNTPGYAISDTLTKGATTITIATNPGGIVAGTWMSIFGNDDPTLISAYGTDGYCKWCADNTGFYLMQQIDQVTAISGSGPYTLTLNRPLYYAPYTSANAQLGETQTNAMYRVMTFPTQYAGFENLSINGVDDLGAQSIITIQGCLYCWVNNVQTYDTGGNSGSAHINMEEDYGIEVRNSYTHDGRSSASGSNYGIYVQWVNSDGKIENNVMRHNRHGFVFQGGGSGMVFLYNYIDDLYTDDLTYLGSARTSHGAHPYFNLFEGNVASHIAGDDFWGTSSHDVFFRNWMWGDETGNGVPSFPPEDGWDAVDLYTLQTYYSYVGNVLGGSKIPTGANSSCQVTTTEAAHTTWSGATLYGFNEYAEAATPIVYSFGAASTCGADCHAPASTTAIKNGNYDYRTNGVTYWDGGSANNAIGNSYYYSSKPAFFGSCAWPPEGYDLSPITNLIPAEAQYLGANVQFPPPASLTAAVH